MSNKKKSISEKMTKAIVSIMLLSSFVIGLAGITGILIINNASQKIYNNDLKPLTSLHKISYDFSCVRVDLRDLILGSQNAKTMEAAINGCFDDMNKQLKIYKGELISADEISNYKSMEEYVSSFSDLKNNIEKSVDSNQPEIAQQMLGENTSDQLNSAITNAFKINSKRAQQRNLSSIEILYIILFAILAVISISAYMSVKTGKRISKKISDPINKLVSAANAISAGNLDIDIDIDEDDETGILAESFKKTITSLRRLDSDIDLLISEALKGNLDKRAELKSHNGEFRKIIDGVNRMLDTVKIPLDVASKYIDNLAEGVKQPSIENIYGGYYTVFIDNLNKVNNAVNILAEETQKLAVAGANGELDVRGNQARLKGIYSDIISGINNTFDAIKNPLDSASDFISKLADGNTGAPLENSYKGYYAELVDNLNNVRRSLIILLGEAQKLVDAGRNGKLEVRGNTQTVNGSYADIIRGMNGIFETIAKPLNESGEVLEKIAVNDFTVSMSENYYGVLKKFAKSINGVRERMLNVEKIFTEISKGSIDSLELLKKSGKLSVNDRMIPSMISTMEAIRELIDETGNQAAAAFEGDLSYRGDVSRFSGGYCKVIEGMNRTMEAVDAPIEESSHVLQQLAQGNLAVEMSGIYNGEYNKIKTSLNNTAAAFNELIGEINLAANQVNINSNQVSDASQLLAQGATEQTSYVEQLTSSIADVAKNTKQNAASAAQASTFAKEAQVKAADGNAKMGKMLESMREINDSSSSISKIIKVIDDIAFQTNILALNAAVEAARAGQYGKGFAVVAQEVRNLAAKSAKAVQQTTELIDGSIKKVESGTKIADETAGMLAAISESVKKASDIVESIALASDKQTNAIMQIDEGITQVLGVVQTNSSTAEESAAMSRELSSQANALIKLVGKFSLK